MIKNVTILKDNIVLVDCDESHEFYLSELLDSRINELLTASDFKKLNYVVKDKGSYFEINVLLYSLQGEEVLLDNIIIDEDFINHYES